MTTFAAADKSVSAQICRHLIGCMLLSCAALSGCGPGNVGTVDGAVTLDGKPLDGGAVVFYPATAGPIYYADINPDGGYHLKTSSHDRVIPGRYIATVSHRSGRPVPGMSVRDIEALETVPFRYCNKGTSGLQYEVVAGRNTLNVEMSTAN